MFEDTLSEAFELGFKQHLAKSDAIRQSIHQDFSAFYFDDYLEIVEIFKRELLNNPFSAETLKTLRFSHVNIIGKVLNRLTSGIYKDRPVRELLDAQPEENDRLEALLNAVKYQTTIKEAFRRAVYFNVCLVQSVYDYETASMRLDLINPNDIKVYTKTDYNKIEKVMIRKADANGNIYFSVWSDDEHYIIQGGNVKAPYNNDKMVNPYRKLPFSVLRIKEGIDFYGEPNWNLFLNQKYSDIRLTDFDKSEMEQIQTAWLGINTKFKPNDVISANKIIQIDNVKPDDYPPSLEAINSNVDYGSVRDNIDWKIKLMYASEGLSSASGSVDITNASGISKMIDENELYERREEFKEMLYDFEIETLKNIRMVNNFHNSEKLNDKLQFEVTFSEEKPMESISDKIARRDMQVKYGYSNAVTFAMEDLEVSEEEALQIIQEIKLQNEQLAGPPTGPPTDNPQDIKTQ